MESENCVDSVTDLACILEIFFKGLSECGLLSTYSVQLQTAVSDVTVHLKFRQHVYQIMKSLQVLLQRISRIPGGKSISTDRATQTEPPAPSETQRPIFRCSKINRPTSKKVIQKVASHLPFHLLKSSTKASFRTKVRPDSIPSENVIDSYDINGSLGIETQSTPLISLKESINVSSSASHSLPTEEVSCSLSNVSHLSPLSNNPVVSSHIGFDVNSSTHIPANSSNQPSQISPSKLDGSESISVQQLHTDNENLLRSVDPSHSCPKHSISTSDILTTSTCSEFSSESQIHSLETSSELVPQDLIAVLDTEDVSNQQQAAVLFLRADDAGEEMSHDEVTIQEEQMENRTIPLEEEDTHPNIQQDSSLYSYTTIVEKEDSNSSKCMKGGMDIVSSLEDHEEDLGLFCKDGVELDPMHSVSVEVVDKDGELMSMFASNNSKEEDDNSTVLYVNGDVLTSKKDVHMGNGVHSKNSLVEHFFHQKMDSRNKKEASFALIGMKMEDVNSRGGSDDDTQEFSERDCTTEEPCNELPIDKEERSDNGAVIGLEDEIDPEDELGQNFVHIVVTASRVIPEKAVEEKLGNVNPKAKRGKCGKKDRNSECTCTTCDTTFPSLSSLQSHLKKKHGNFNQCDFCQKAFPTIGSLVDHCRDMHDGVGCFECEECGKRLKSRLSLRRHQESHQGRKEAVCHECGKTFCRGDYLIRHHQMVHAGERPYQCTHCSQRFLSRGHLRNHLSVHTGERNHKCGICGKMFSRSDKLREHVLRHLSAKRHSCPSCGRSYADKRDLNKHQLREPGCNPGDSVTMQIDAVSSPLESHS